MQATLVDYRHQVLVWAALAPHAKRRADRQPPKVPDLLKPRPYHGNA